jgi:hypothetical protein
MNEIKKFLGVWNKHLERKELIYEMQQRHIDAIRKEIEEAESGTSTKMPFNDIFGMPETSNPKTRMIMPYGNEDIEKFKFALETIEQKVRAELRIEQIKWGEQGTGNVKRFKPPAWKVATQIAQQKQKPQGWQEGDPIETYEKTTGNIVLEYFFTPSKGKGIERKVEIGFAKALQKYLPDYFEWWQGGKGKEGKHAFFTNNPVLSKQLVDIINGGDYDSTNPPSKAGMTLFSRHPIDVLRMSDFKKIKSCHSPPEKGGEYWNRCRMEAKNNAGGGILFTVSPEEIDTLFPDGVIAQKGDIFNDNDRSIYGRLSDPDSRLRVRKVVDKSTNIEYAVPDQKIYGDYNTTFRAEGFEFLAGKQKEKFIKGDKAVIPSPDNLFRYGASYEDSYSVGQNFLELMRITSRQGDVEFVGDQYQVLRNALQTNSIQWGGSASEEDALEDNTNECTPLMDACDQINNSSYGILSLLASAECHNDPPYADLSGYLAAYIPFDNLESWFRGEIVQSRGNNYQKQRELEKVIKRDDPLGDIAGIGFEYMDLPFEDVEISVEPHPTTGDLTAKVQLEYRETLTDPREVVNRGRDARNFSQKVTQEQLESAVQIAFETLGWAKEAAFASRANEIEDFSAWVDEQEHFSSDIDDKKALFEYSNMILDEFSKNLPSQFTSEIQSRASIEAITSEFAYNFRQAFDKRAAQYKKEIEKQMPLFDGMQDGSGMEFQKMPVFIEPSITIRQNHRGGFPATPEKQTVEVKFYLKMQLDRTLTEQQVEYALRFIKQIVDDEDVILSIAYAQLKQVLSTPALVSLQERRNSFEQSKKLRKLLKEWYVKQGKK